MINWVLGIIIFGFTIFIIAKMVLRAGKGESFCCCDKNNSHCNCSKNTTN